MHRTTRSRIASLGCRLVAAGILLQTLYFKFTAAPESVYIFGRLGLEPWGRIGSGVAELVAAVLLVLPGTAALGALLALGIISGAIASHLAVLGIVVRDDGGLLFALALAVWSCSAAVLVLERESLRALARRLRIPLRRGAGRAATATAR
jgi:hypothetical protein